MTKNLGNLETWYNGFHFRSRTEARWAVFFDAAKIKYIHEPEAFTFNGMNYLPDFYLPDEDMYVEVKPPREGFEEELNKAITVMTGNKKILIILMDIPFNSECNVWWFPVVFFHPLYEYSVGQRITFIENDEDELKIVKDWAVGVNSRVGTYRITPSDFEPLNDLALDQSDFPPRSALQCELLDRAYKMARGYRFDRSERKNKGGE